VTAYTVRPGPLFGSILAPPSKSYTHRELIASYLAAAPSLLLRPLDCDDTRRTLVALQRLGAQVRIGVDRWRVSPPADRPKPKGKVVVQCGRSGTTLRFLAGLAGVLDREVELRGDAQLARRPLGPLLDYLESAGAEVRRARPGRSLPITIRGPVRRTGGAIDATESSQFASALLLALPVRPARSQVSLRGRPVSAPYLAATVDVLRRRGVRWRRRGATFRIDGPARIQGGTVSIPGDASSAAYLWAAGAISGGVVEVRGVPTDRPQADLRILPTLAAMGSSVIEGREGITLWGRPERAIRTDLTEAPDLLPLVGVIAAGARSPSLLTGARQAALKETDRRRTTLALVRQLGASASDGRAGLRIVPHGSLRPIRRTLPDDHRLVMSAAVAALRAGGVVRPAEAVEKSYPDFWRDLRALGADLRRSGP
jgi:3-phosphoshikimate 1-carboxyvinyltransferase